MAARAAFPRDIVVDELAVARCTEARKMPAMHDADMEARRRSIVAR